MEKLAKILFIALLLTFLPLKQWGQTPYRQYADNGILLDFHDIDDVYFRACLLYNLSQDSRFILMANDEPGQFSISSDEGSGITNLYEAFDAFYNDTYNSFGMLDKRDVSSRFPQWKSCVASAHFQSIMMDITLRNSRPNDNNHCIDSDPFCTSDVITFDAATSSQTADDLEGTTLQDGCISSSPNPSWYHMRIQTGGQFVIHMEGHDPSNGTTRDIDFCIWGPFDDPTSPCVAQLTTNKIIDCSYSASYTEDIYLGYQLSEHDHDGSSLADGTITYHVPEVGEYYILMICNYSQQPCTISFTKTEGIGETDCGILPGIVSNDGPYCVGETINLTVNQQAGATYTWTGPNGFTSSQQNPVRPNCTLNMAGTYTCVTTVGAQTTSATTEVVIYAQPTANFNATTVCQGNPTQFTSTSTTNPAGQTISSFQWRFGDGQTGTGQTTSHTYSQPGSYQVTLTVSTGNGRCSHEITKTITVEPLPEANFTATTVCQGEPTQFTSTSEGDNIDSYQWDFGDNQTGTGQATSHTYTRSGTYQVTLTVSSSNGTCSDNITQTITVNPTPTASFDATTVCQGEATQFTSTAGGQAIESYQWNFGDHQTGTGQTTNHTYAQAGTYQVTLTVESASGCSDVITQTVTVNPLPTSNFTATTVCQGDPTQFTSTTEGDHISSYQWSFGDGQTGTGQAVSHTYTQAGTYQVTLAVETAGGCSDVITQTITVNPLPTSNFTATSVCQGDPTQFTSTAEGDHISNYQWSFGDGQTGTGQTVSHTYTQAGNYPVTLNVQTSGGCSDSFTQTVEVFAMPIASATAQPSTVIYGANTTLSANAGTQGTFDFHWEPANLVVNPNAQTTQTVALQESQTFTVTITNPQGGCTSTAQVIVSLDGSGLMAMASADQTDLCDGESTTIHAIPSGGAIDNYTFEWSPANTLSNAHSQHPVATPGLGNTTYTCHVNDGFSDINVSVTLHVHPNVEKDIYQTICENDTYSFFGQDVHTPGVYDHTLHTQFGCDSIVHLHLDNWLTYETSTTDNFCQNDQYQFFDQTIDAAGTYYHTLQSSHGCDSTIRLTLLQDPVYEFEMWESTCEGGDGYLYAGQYLQPRIEPYIFNYPTVKQCDSTIIIHIEEAEYNSKNYNVSLCGSEYTWVSNGITYYETGVYYDTLHYTNTCDSTLILNLELRPIHDHDILVSSCDDYRWKDDTYNVDMTFTESTVYTQHYINTFGCESEATLYLTINDHDESAFIVPDDENCDEYFWDPQGHEIVYTDHADSVYNISGVYHRTYKNQADCDSLVTMSVQFDYTPHPTPIYPMDNDNTTPHWVVTATEFQINAYDYNLWDINPNCQWDTVTWTSEGAPNWIIEPFGDQGKCCKLYVLNHVEDTVWLTAHAFNRCAPDEGIIQRYWLVCSFYGLDEQNAKADFQVVPNPNKGQMTLNFEHLIGKVNIKVYDMHGALIDQFETYNGVGPSTYQYQMKSKVDGIYFIVATSKEGTIAKKVIIQR